MNNWNFPSNGGGQIRGYADAGIETFSGKELNSLVREVCQNSLDACLEDDKPVIVEFNREFKRVDTMPGYDSFREALKKCNAYWTKSESQKAISFLKEANKDFNNPNKYHYILRISDYNTTGLSDPYGDSFDGWNALTKIDGGATKNGDTAGSFGIGKNAPYCYSYYRTLFYRTLNKDGEYASQGMARLLSFPTDLSDRFNSMTSGIGYFGDPNNNRPVKYIEALEELGARNEIGTDIFIYGFTIENSSWYRDVIVSVLENFLVSIFNNKLVVKVGKEIINKSNLNFYIQEYKNELKHAQYNYEVLNSEEIEPIVFDFHELGNLNLKLLVSKTEKKDQQVLVVRTSGMKLFHLKRMGQRINFSAILELQGTELNKFFREMETPAHDKWEPSRHSDSKKARIYYQEIKEFVRKTIWEFGEYTSDDELDVEGLSDILLANEEEGTQLNENELEGLNDHLGIIEIAPKPMLKEDNIRGLFYGDGGNHKSKTKRAKGTVSKKGDSPAVRTLGGTRKRRKREKHKGRANDDGHDSVIKPSGAAQSIYLEHVRMIHLNGNKYKLIFQVPKPVYKGYVEIVAIGENGKDNKLNIVNVKDLANSNESFVKNGCIYFSNLSDMIRTKMEFELYDNHSYAMEVRVYETN